MYPGLGASHVGVLNPRLALTPPRVPRPKSKPPPAPPVPTPAPTPPLNQKDKLLVNVS